MTNLLVSSLFVALSPDTLVRDDRQYDADDCADSLASRMESILEQGHALMPTVDDGILSR